MKNRIKRSSKVLIVDDDAGILDAISMILVEEGYDVEAVSRGDEIHNKVVSFKPDVILLDVLISGSDGRIICRQLKQRQGSKHIPIIMISAHPSAELSAKNYGADLFVSKPFDMETLLTALSRYTP